jgi:hypothetical protein
VQPIHATATELARRIRARRVLPLEREASGREEVAPAAARAITVALGRDARPPLP